MPRAKKDAPAAPRDENDALVDQLLKLRAKSKLMFAQQNEVEGRLLEALAAAKGRIELASGRVLARKDNFEDKNTFFKPTAVKRFEVLVA